MSWIINPVHFTRDAEGHGNFNYYLAFEANFGGFWHEKFFEAVASSLKDKKEGKEYNRTYIGRDSREDLVYQICQNDDIIVAYVPGKLFYIGKNTLSFSSEQIVCLPTGQHDIDAQAKQYFQDLLVNLDGIEDFKYNIVARKSEKTVGGCGWYAKPPAFANAKGIVHYIRYGGKIECPDSEIEDLAIFLNEDGWKFEYPPDFDISSKDRQGSYIYDTKDDEYGEDPFCAVERWAESRGMELYAREDWAPKRDLISFLEGWISEGGFVPSGKLEEDYEATFVVPWIVDRYIIASPGLTQHALGAEMAKRKDQGEVERKYRERAASCGIKV